MDEETVGLIEEICSEELEEDEAEEISKALDKAELQELKDALKVFSAFRRDLPSEINEAAEALTKLVTKLAGEAYGYKPKPKEEEEEEEEGEKVKKKADWSFNLGVAKED